MDVDILNSMDDTTRALFVEAALGDDAIAFLNSDLGRLLKGRAEAQIHEAMTELLTIVPSNTQAIATAQHKAALADQFLTWIGDAITNGQNARAQLNEEHNAPE